MKLIWGLLRPDLLTHKVGLLSVAQSHWVARKMKIYDGMHEWLPMYCPCYEDVQQAADSRALLGESGSEAAA